jgi:hypothetical protein
MAAMTRNTVLLLVLVTTAVLLCSVVPAAAASRRVLVGQQPQAATDSVKGLGGGVTGVGAGGAGDVSDIPDGDATHVVEDTCWIYALEPIGLDPLMDLMDLIH